MTSEKLSGPFSWHVKINLIKMSKIQVLSFHICPWQGCKKPHHRFISLRRPTSAVCAAFNFRKLSFIRCFFSLLIWNPDLQYLMQYWNAFVIAMSSRHSHYRFLVQPLILVVQQHLAHQACGGLKPWQLNGSQLQRQARR